MCWTFSKHKESTVVSTWIHNTQTVRQEEQYNNIKGTAWQAEDLGGEF